jgi:hypothetical protein
LGSWYDRGENEYFISRGSTNSGSRTDLEVQQKRGLKPDRELFGAGWVEGETVVFNCGLPLMGRFEGRLVRSGSKDLDTLVGQYSTVESSWKVTLYRSP